MNEKPEPESAPEVGSVDEMKKFINIVDKGEENGGEKDNSYPPPET